ncbi:polyprenyl synthetase family protein [Rhodococcus cerastii]|nr:polyprenyl synthetase family protein [Rhodococcus cerastii]
MTSELRSDVRSRVESANESVERLLSRFLARKREFSADMIALPGLIDMLEGLLEGGKKIRPTLCIAGWYAGGGEGPVPNSVQTVAASLEMFHAFALIHDDVMDRSTIRRGRPTVHEQFAESDRFSLTSEENVWLSNCAAILVGDLALCWAFELLHSAQLTPEQVSSVYPILDSMRSEAMYGQYLDLAGTGNLSLGVEELLTAVRYKTAKYTLERPLQVGAALANTDFPYFQALSEFSLPVGEAFQLRDDLLDVFGDPSLTGKSTLDDIREYRNTVLAKTALSRGDDNQVHMLMQIFGKKDLGTRELETIVNIFTDTGAQDIVERMIRDRYTRAVEVLGAAKLPRDAEMILKSLAQSTLWRRV